MLLAAWVLPDRETRIGCISCFCSQESLHMSTRPWNDWYHCMGSTYGTWLPGDPRGFRTRHHREHIEGDYRNPPPKGMYEARHKRSKDLMKHDVVYLTQQQRNRAAEEFVRSIHKWKLDAIVFSIDRIHFHILLRAPLRNPRHYLGLMKKESSAYMKQVGLAPQGGLWGKRCECKPIADGAHHARVIKYINDHAQKGAVVWNRPEPNPMDKFDPDGLLIE
jgi:hypothetical protein